MSESEAGGGGPPRRSLATGLLRYVFASCLFSALLVSGVALQSVHETVQRALEHEYPARLARLASAQRALFERGRLEIEALARGADWRGREAARERLARALEHSPSFDALALLARDGTPRLALGRDAARLAGLAPEPGLRAGAAPDDAPALWLEPVPDGFLAGALRVDVLRRHLEAETPTAGGQVRILRADGSPVLWAEDEADAALVAVAALPEPDSVYAYRDALGRFRVGARADAGHLGWQLVVEAPFRLAFAPLLATGARLLALDVCVLLGVLGFASRYTRAVVVPIRRLAEGARHIGEGELDELEETGRGDEIDLLTRAFNDVVRTLRRDRIEVERVNRSLMNTNQDLRQANEVLSQLSITDGLTKLHNHRFFQDHLSREIKRVQRSGEPLSIILTDIDDFKKLNDRLGHAAGDEVLVGIARIMETTIRDCDLLARYGGEEFVVLASGTDRLGAYQLAEKIRMAVNEASFILGDSLRPMRISVSIGVAQYEGNRRKFFDAADRCLYDAKAQGKNCVIVDEVLC